MHLLISFHHQRNIISRISNDLLPAAGDHETIIHYLPVHSECDVPLLPLNSHRHHHSLSAILSSSFLPPRVSILPDQRWQVLGGQGNHQSPSSESPTSPNRRGVRPADAVSRCSSTAAPPPQFLAISQSKSQDRLPVPVLSFVDLFRGLQRDQLVRDHNHA